MHEICLDGFVRYASFIRKKHSEVDIFLRLEDSFECLRYSEAKFHRISRQHFAPLSDPLFFAAIDDESFCECSLYGDLAVVGSFLAEPAVAFFKITSASDVIWHLRAECLSPTAFLLVYLSESPNKHLFLRTMIISNLQCSIFTPSIDLGAIHPIYLKSQTIDSGTFIFISTTCKAIAVFIDRDKSIKSIRIAFDSSKHSKQLPCSIPFIIYSGYLLLI